MDRIRVVWICHFSNEQIRNELPLSKRRFSNFIRYVLKKPTLSYSDFAPWISSLIVEFEKLNDVELHIISPHLGLKHIKHELVINGIHYHFFNPEFPFIYEKVIINLIKLKKRGFYVNRFLIKRFLSRINPDLVNLIGTENPYYSIATLDITNKPVFVSVQTVYANPKRMLFSENLDIFTWNTELQIIKKEKYYGCAGRMHRDLILISNPSALIFKMFFPIQHPTSKQEGHKEFDFVFFASEVSLKKGIEDAIDALALVVKDMPDISLNVVGHCTSNYKKVLLEKIKSLGLINNIVFNDYFPIQSDMHKHLQKSRFALLPVKLDIISSAIIEAILLGLPVISYKTTGTPYLNKAGETVLLSEIGDICNLADNMLRVLNSADLAKKLSFDSRVFVGKEFDNTNSAKQLVRSYFAVIDHYNYGTSIPDELLFNPEEFPIY